MTWIVASYSITSKRNQQGIDFAGPYMQSDQGLLVRAGDTSIRDKADLAGKSVCMVGATTGSMVPLPGANTVTHRETTQDCVDMLARGDTDAVFTDTLILYGFMQVNPGKYRVVLSGVFGTPQFYGIGLLGGHLDECHRLNAIIKDYLRVQWRIDFKAHLPTAVAAAAADGGFESRFKPPEVAMRKLSCQVAKEPPRPM
ncbi:hypothetical protein [Actinoplanes sp. NPDC049265]|uniref:hypothetical protein n=1 Tax=Actinoplanes sp. NPDC049265 TaxID=3363902 RepID=UPI00371E2E31